MAKSDGRRADPRKGRPAKAAPVVDSDGRFYRSRPTVGPFGDPEPPTEGTLTQVLERHAADTELGLEPVVEYRVPGIPWLPWRRPVLVTDLPHHLRHQREDSRWLIEPEGARMLRRQSLES